MNKEKWNVGLSVIAGMIISSVILGIISFVIQDFDSNLRLTFMGMLSASISVSIYKKLSSKSS